MLFERYGRIVEYAWYIQKTVNKLSHIFQVYLLWFCCCFILIVQMVQIPSSAPARCCVFVNNGAQYCSAHLSHDFIEITAEHKSGILMNFGVHKREVTVYEDFF